MPQAVAMKFDHTQYLLEQWAIWVRKTNELAAISFPSSVPYYSPLTAATNMLVITEDEACFIDGLVARLKKRDIEMGRVVINYYLSKGSLSYVASKCEISIKRARILAEAGTSWIDAIIDN